MREGLTRNGGARKGEPPSDPLTDWPPKLHVVHLRLKLETYKSVSNTSALSSIDIGGDTHLCKLRDIPAPRSYRGITLSTYTILVVSPW